MAAAVCQLLVARSAAGRAVQILPRSARKDQGRIAPDIARDRTRSATDPDDCVVKLDATIVIDDPNNSSRGLRALFECGSVLPGRLGGGFQAEVPYAVGRYPESVALGDLNGDGRLDIVTADAYSNDVSVLPNLGGAAGPSIRLVIERPLYTTGERKVTRVDLLGQGEPADLYLLVEWPDGRRRYAFYLDGTWDPPGKLLAFSEEKLPVLRGARLEGQTGLVLNDYTFTGGEEEGVYTWTLTAEDPATGRALASGNARYEFGFGTAGALGVSITAPGPDAVLQRGGQTIVSALVSFDGRPFAGARAWAQLEGPAIWPAHLGFLRDDGTGADGAPADGAYSLVTTLPFLPPDGYRLTVKAQGELQDGQVIRGSAALAIVIEDGPSPYVGLDLAVRPVEGPLFLQGAPAALEATVAYPDGLTRAGTRVRVDIDTPTGGRQALDLVHQGGGVYAAQFTPAAPGDHAFLALALPPAGEPFDPGHARAHVRVYAGELVLEPRSVAEDYELFETAAFGIPERDVGFRWRCRGSRRPGRCGRLVRGRVAQRARGVDPGIPRAGGRHLEGSVHVPGGRRARPHLAGQVAHPPGRDDCPRAGQGPRNLWAGPARRCDRERRGGEAPRDQGREARRAPRPHLGRVAPLPPREPRVARLR